MSPFKDMTMVRNSILGVYHHPFFVLPRPFTPGETFADAGSISRYDGTRWCIIRGWNRTSISKPLMTCSIRLGMECLLQKMTKTRGSSNEESDNDIVGGAFYRLQTARGELCEKAMVSGGEKRSFATKLCQSRHQILCKFLLTCGVTQAGVRHGQYHQVTRAKRFCLILGSLTPSLLPKSTSEPEEQLIS